ncbi:MAG: alpha/beta hydrolase [Methanoregula sp.]|jgi:pimeloyl-ACP methyl ester carboxylesterase
MTHKSFAMIVPVLLLLAVLLALAGCTGTPARPDSTSTLVPAVPAENITKAEMKTVPVGDITIAYKEIGSGEPLILIMGYSGTMDLWDTRLVNQLAQHYRVIIFDNRGMGNSTSSDREYTIRLFAEDTAGLMDALGIKKAHVMGWSMGTFVAQELTLSYPEKVEKLILYAGTPGGKEALSPAPQDIAALTNMTGTDRERGERLFGELFPSAWLKENPDPSKYFPRVTEMSAPVNVMRQDAAILAWNGTSSRLPALKQPLLLIAGEQDVIAPPGNSLLIAEQVPQSWVVRIRGGGHGLMYQYPDEFASIVITFLEHGT